MKGTFHTLDPFIHWITKICKARSWTIVLKKTWWLYLYLFINNCQHIVTNPVNICTKICLMKSGELIHKNLKYYSCCLYFLFCQDCFFSLPQFVSAPLSIYNIKWKICLVNSVRVHHSENTVTIWLDVKRKTREGKKNTKHWTFIT